jgi:hypothetical protein
VKLLFSAGLKITALVFFLPCAGAGDFSGEEISGVIAEVSKPASMIDWAGYYLEKSELCTALDGSASCAEKFNDCLSIKPTALGFLVELNSTQAYQHVCSFSLEMEADNSALVYQSQLGQVFVERNGGVLEISSKGIDPTALGLGVCGTHADIDGLRFSIANKSRNTSQCGSPK